MNINEGGVLDLLHSYSEEVLSQSRSSSVHCRYPKYIDSLCKHIGARERIYVAKVYPSLVKMGYGIEYNAYENIDVHLSDTVDRIFQMRASTDINEMEYASVLTDVISFSDTTREFVYSHDFVAEMYDYANDCDVKLFDMYLYYALVGLKKLGETEEYSHFKTSVHHIGAMYELENIDLRRTNETKDSLISHIERIPTEETRKRMSASHQGISIEEWDGFISFGKYCPKFNKAFKESIREKFGRKCFGCDKTEEENGRKLSVHHVNYDKNCGCDGNYCEFVPLCNKCHPMTNGNREMWERLIMNVLSYERWI